MASCKMIHIFAVSKYQNEMRLIKIRILNCWLSTNMSRILFFNFDHILVMKHVKASEIFSVNTLKSNGIVGITEKVK